MKAPREYKRWLNRLRSRQAKRGVKNGSIGWVDDPWMELVLTGSKRRHRRNRLAFSK